MRKIKRQTKTMIVGGRGERTDIKLDIGQYLGWQQSGRFKYLGSCVTEVKKLWSKEIKTVFAVAKQAFITRVWAL